MKALSYKVSTAFLLACMLAWLPVHAQSFKVGFVSTDRILRDSNIAHAAQKELEKEFSGREKALVAEGNALQAASNKLEREVPTLSESQRATRQHQLMEQDRNFQIKRHEFQEDLATRKNEELSRVLQRANAVVEQIAKSQKYDMILQEVVYVNPQYDITDQVIKTLNSSK